MQPLKAVQAFSKVTGSIKTQAEKDIIELKIIGKGAISQEDYEAKVAKITADAAKDANDAMIANLRTILSNTKLSEEKRAEYSEKLTELEIANETPPPMQLARQIKKLLIQTKKPLHNVWQ